MEIITTGVSRLSRDPDRTSTGSTQSTGSLEKHPRCYFKYSTLVSCVHNPSLIYTHSDKESSPAPRGVMPSSLPGSNPFEGVKAEEEEEEEGFVDPELPYQVAEDGKGGDSFNMFPSRADEALKTCKHTENRCLKNQVLHMQ